MRTYLECLPCLMRQTVDATRHAGADLGVQGRVLRETLRMLAQMDPHQSPPAMAQRIHRLIRAAVGDPDPYARAKRRLNRLALRLYPALRRRVRAAADPLAAALRMAAAANVLDLGVTSGIAEPEVRRVMESAMTAPLDPKAIRAFRRAAASARRILYIGDNAGEIVLDRLLVEELGAEKVVFAVRGGPVINDATRADAVTSGLAGVVEIIDSGSDAPGTVLTDCGRAFRRCFARADLVLAKGQGNYETLSDAPRPVFFLLRAKCPVVARDLRCAVGSLVLRRSAGHRPAGCGDRTHPPPAERKADGR